MQQEIKRIRVKGKFKNGEPINNVFYVDDIGYVRASTRAEANFQILSQNEDVESVEIVEER